MPPLPYRKVDFEGFEILIGKSAEDNDVLTRDYGQPADAWLHVAEGIAGSHVVVRNPDGLDRLPGPVLKRAAELAAWYSKARDRKNVKVHCCAVADVSKKRHHKDGTVEISRWEELTVKPQGPTGSASI